MPKSQADALMGSDNESTTEQEFQGAVWSDTVTIDPTKLSIPFLTLTQSNSKAVVNEQAKMGQWVLDGYPPSDTVVIVPMKYGESRRYSIEQNNQLVTACYCPTGGNHGIALLPEGPGMECAECPLAQWTPTDKKGPTGRAVNAAPLCKEAFDFIAFSATHSMPVKISFRSTAVKVGRQIAGIGLVKGLGQFAVELGSKKEQKGNMIFSIPTVMILDQEEAEQYLDTAVRALGSGGN